MRPNLQFCGVRVLNCHLTVKCENAHVRDLLAEARAIYLQGNRRRCVSQPRFIRGGA